MASPTGVLLVGLMGAGKSTIGRSLAAHLEVPYLDNDELLAQREQRSTLDLAADGKDVLHAAESRQLRSLADQTGSWVAGAAGSLGDRPSDCRFVNERFFCVYLHVEPDELVRRIRQDPRRPWVDDDVAGVVHDMYERRDDAFRRLAAVVAEATRPVDEVTALILNALGARTDSLHGGAAGTEENST